MKNLSTLSLLSILFLSFSCSKNNRETPACILNQITTFDTTYDCDKAKVDRYTFQGKDVYVFDPGVCAYADMASEVLNENCESIGFLGGLIGNTQINGEDFSNAHYEETIWTK